MKELGIWRIDSNFIKDEIISTRNIYMEKGVL